MQEVEALLKNAETAIVAAGTALATVRITLGRAKKRLDKLEHEHGRGKADPGRR